MKRIISLFLAVLLLLSMAACSRSASGQGEKAGREKLPKNAVVLDSGSAGFAEELEQAVRDMATPVYIRNLGAVTVETLWGMEYGAFWVDSIKVEKRLEKFILDGDTEPAYYDILHITYTDESRTQIEKMKDEIDAKADEIASLVPAGADIWEKTRMVHDELCRRIAYEEAEDVPHVHDAYGALIEGKAVCSGYAAAFTVIMKKLGISCPAVVSKNHAWNKVQSAGTYEQYIDVTWDDRNEYDNEGSPYISHEYFGLTREELLSLDHHATLDGAGEMWLADPQVFNYYRHEGYYLESADPDGIIGAFRKQLAEGSNLLTIRFAREEDYQQSRTWENGDRDILREYAEASGYSGSFSFSYNDSLRTVSVFLNPKIK